MDSVGIDLGTTYSAISVTYANGTSDLIEDRKYHTKIHASAVYFTPEGKVIVGNEALIAAREAGHEGRVAIDAKSVRGMKLADAGAQGLELVSIGGEKDRPAYAIGEEAHSALFVEALVVRHLLKLAETRLKSPIRKATISVPANFNAGRVYATRQIAQIAGLSDCSIIVEPTAAAMAYSEAMGCMHLKHTIVVFDWGGGTIDVSVIQTGISGWTTLSTEGNTRLGGRDVTKRLAEVIGKKICELREVQSFTPEETMAIKAAAESMKKSLTEETEVSFKFDEEVHVVVKRSEFETAVADLMDSTIGLIDKALAAAHLRAGDVDEVVMAGGSCNMPMVDMRLRDYFHKAPRCEVDPSQIVATGAGIAASKLLVTNRRWHLSDVTPLSLGYKAVDKNGEMKAHRKVIAKNRPYPCTGYAVITTMEDGQDGMSTNILQGESELAELCEDLGPALFSLLNAQAYAKSKARVQLKFTLYANGELLVVGHQATNVNTRKLDYDVEVFRETYKLGPNCLDEEELSELRAKAQALIPLKYGDAVEDAKSDESSEAGASLLEAPCTSQARGVRPRKPPNAPKKEAREELKAKGSKIPSMEEAVKQLKEISDEEIEKEVPKRRGRGAKKRTGSSAQADSDLNEEDSAERGLAAGRAKRTTKRVNRGDYVP